MGDQVYYEVVGSEIYRVGVKPKAGLIYTAAMERSQKEC